MNGKRIYISGAIAHHDIAERVRVDPYEVLDNMSERVYNAIRITKKNIQKLKILSDEQRKQKD